MNEMVAPALTGGSHGGKGEPWDWAMAFGLHRMPSIKMTVSGNRHSTNLSPFRLLCELSQLIVFSK
jgi:hypothetical protein